MSETLLVQCGSRESGGVQCEVLLVTPDEDHGHWISQATIDRHLRRPFYTQITFSRPVGPCPCECNSGGFCGGCGHAGCGGRR